MAGIARRDSLFYSLAILAMREWVSGFQLPTLDRPQLDLLVDVVRAAFAASRLHIDYVPPDKLSVDRTLQDSVARRFSLAQLWGFFYQMS